MVPRPRNDNTRGQSRNRRPVVSPSVQRILLGLAVTVGLVVVIWTVRQSPSDRATGPQRSNFTLDQIPFDGRKAMDYLRYQCEIGPRPSGSDSMLRQQQWLIDHFQNCGAEVEAQSFAAEHPETGQAVPMTNLIARWRPQRTERILLGGHYDTLPYPLLDPIDPKGVFVGAHDNASGVAVLMVLAESLDVILEQQTRYGVDIVLFDGEEFIFEEGQPMFLGSTHFARQYAAAAETDPMRYRWGVIIDMVGDADLQLPKEGNSVSWRDTRPLVDAIWDTAARLGVTEFLPRSRYDIRDDHVPLHDIGKIPACDIIDFDYRPWHTSGDIPERCSPLSLAKVGWVVSTWLETAP